MAEKTVAVREAFLSALEGVLNTEELEKIRVEYIGKKGFVTELMKEMKDLSVEEKKTFRVTDEEAKRIIKKYSKCETATDFQLLDVKQRNKCIKTFKEKGVSIRQISRLTGISKGIVERI